MLALLLLDMTLNQLRILNCGTLTFIFFFMTGKVSWALFIQFLTSSPFAGDQPADPSCCSFSLLLQIECELYVTSTENLPPGVLWPTSVCYNGNCATLIWASSEPWEEYKYRRLQQMIVFSLMVGVKRVCVFYTYVWNTYTHMCVYVHL